MNSGSFKKGEKRPNQGKRGPGKATQQAREAIGMFVDGNAHRLQDWLDKVANGVQNEDGDYIVPPNPEKAFTLFQSVVEYHVPKLARTELAGDQDNPIGITEVVRRVVRAAD